MAKLKTAEIAPNNPPDDLENVADLIVANAPDPSQHAIEAHESEQLEQENNAERDIDGVAFDESIHTGSRLKNGRWRTRKGPNLSIVGREKRSRNPDPVQAPEIDTARLQQEASCKAAGAVAAASVFMLGRAIGGDEWRPTEQEIAMQNEAWGAYFLAKGIDNIPPSLVLTIAIGSYAAPRFAQPETSAKIKRVKRWFALRVGAWKLRREYKKRGINATVLVRNGEVIVSGARSDMRDNSERKDVPSKEDGEHLSTQ